MWPRSGGNAYFSPADLAECNFSDIEYRCFCFRSLSFSTGLYSWYDFAKKIHQLAGVDKVSPIETKDYPTAAARPHYSVLNKSKDKIDLILKFTLEKLNKMCGYFYRSK